MINPQKFQTTYEARRTPRDGVTFVGFYGADKPAALLNFQSSLKRALNDTVSHHRDLVRVQETEWLHATICGLEGAKDQAGNIVTNNMKERARNTGEAPRPFLVEEFLAFVRNAQPIRFRFGGYDPQDVNPHDLKRSPWTRSFEMREDGLAVLMGWPADKNDEPFAFDLHNLRMGVQKFGVVHKYHLTEGDIDNDFFMVIAALEHPVWTRLSDEERRQVSIRLDQFQQELRNTLQREPFYAELSPNHLWIVQYRTTTLADVVFAKRVTDITAGEVRRLYGP